MRVKLSEIIDAIEMMDQESEYFIDKETGEIVLINDFTMTSEERETACEQLDEHGFYRLPTSFDIREYDIMEDFVYSLPNPAREKLSRAISGRGAFRRFKDSIRQLGVEQQWYDYQADAYKKKAVKWCKDNDLKYE